VDKLFKRGSLIVKSDPVSYSRDPVASLISNPLINDLLPVLDFNWSILNPLLVT
jgi:hypothetical protein